jgi:hypothetical protein
MMVKTSGLKAVVGFSFLLSLGFWLAGLAAAPDRTAFVHNIGWLYQIVWLPAHILCGYLAMAIYRSAQTSCNPSAAAIPVGIKPYLNYLFRKWLIASLAVLPFLIMDGIEGYDMVLEEFASMGRSGWLLLAVWAIEWVATGVLWVHVLLTLKLTFDFYNETYVRDHLESILITSKNSPLLIAGVENSLVILLFALATFGYIWLAGGELSDFVALGVSAIFVLIAFLGSMLHLKIKINRVLDDIYEARLHTLLKLTTAPADSIASSGQTLLSLQQMDQLIFNRPTGISPRSYARLRAIKASLLLQTDVDTLQMGREMFRYTEFEIRLATVGVAELRAVLMRLSAPLAGLVAKSGLLGGA